MANIASRRAGTAVLAVCIALTVTGCEQGVPLGTVSGLVTKDGQPQANMWVTFQPANGRPAEGRTNGSGEFELVYSASRKGALVGPTKVTIYSGGETDSRDNVLSPRVEVLSKDVEVESGENRFEFELP
jgi:hypothetical protein